MTRVFPMDAAVVMERPGFLYEVLAAVDAFCLKYGSEDTGPGLAKDIIDALHMEHPTTLVWVAVDEEWRLLTHAIATVLQRGKARWVEISQLERHDAADMPAILEGFGEIEKWGASFGATEVRLLTVVDVRGGKITSGRGRLFERVYGFKPYRLLMTKEIDNA